MSANCLSSEQVEQIANDFQKNGVDNDDEAAILAALWHHPGRPAVISTLVVQTLDTGRIMPLLVDGPHWSSTEVDLLYPYLAEALSETDIPCWMATLPGVWENTSVPFRAALLDLLTRLASPAANAGFARRQRASQAMVLRDKLALTPGLVDKNVLSLLQSFPDARTRTWAQIEIFAH